MTEVANTRERITGTGFSLKGCTTSPNGNSSRLTYVPNFPEGTTETGAHVRHMPRDIIPRHFTRDTVHVAPLLLRPSFANARDPARPCAGHRPAARAADRPAAVLPRRQDEGRPA